MKKQGTVHFIAIGGIGMSALAKILLESGVAVSGSDVKVNAGTERLVAAGATVSVGHDAAHIPADCVEVVYSSAIRPDNPEMVAAKERGIPLTHRGELLARLFNDGRGTAVAGAHGKTTTTGMLAQIFEAEGLGPNIAIGGFLPLIGSNAKKGRSDLWVAEADESDGSFLKLAPARAVITNIDPEHMNYYGTSKHLEDAFYEFADGCGELILCLDDRRTKELAAKLKRPYFAYGLDSDDAELTAVNIRPERLSVAADVVFRGEKVADLRLGVPGRHNVANALAALYCGFLEGVPFDRGAADLVSFRGTGRRFEILFNDGDVVLVDDYAHHPTEVAATVAAAKDGGYERVIAVFQPHRYSRVQELYIEFGKAFAAADVVIIDDIYSAWEEPIEGISAELIVEEIRKNGGDPLYFGDVEKIVAWLLENSRKGDLILMMGAGNIRETAERLRDLLTEAKR